jgi:hypothetical protein
MKDVTHKARAFQGAKAQQVDFQARVRSHFLEMCVLKNIYIYYVE